MKKLLLTLGAIASVAAPVAAVVACGTTPAKTPTHIDEGFNNASLIENFDMATESQTKDSTFSIKFDGKTYADASLFAKDWEVAIQSFFDNDKDLHGAYPDGIMSLKIEGDKYSITLKHKNGANIQTSPNSPDSKWENFDENVNKILSVPGFADWNKLHKVEADVKSKITPPKDSIDSIIYSKAQSLTNTIKTDHDKAFIGKYKGNVLDGHTKDLNLRPYVGGNSGFFDMTTEYRPGDSIIFAFDNEQDLASFTQRVRYDNTSDYDNNMPIEKVGLKTIKYQPISIQNGQLMAAQVKDYSMGDGVSIFKLDVIARNAVELTFNDMFTPSNYHVDAQLLYLSAFTDENKDGKINKNDVNMVGPFTVDKDHPYSNYNTIQYIHKATTIAAYDEFKATYDSL